MHWRRYWLAFTASAALGWAVCASVALAATMVSGAVTTEAGKPVAHARVSLSGAGRSERVESDAAGRFAFVSVVAGEYDVVASSPAGVARVHLVVTDAPVELELRLVPGTLGRVVVVSGNSLLRNGGSTTVSAVQLAHSPATTSLAGVFLQLPGAVHGSNGQVHFNGEHGDINYSLDGVPLPQELNRVIGSEVDASIIGSLEVIEGAFPAKYGNNFGAEMNIATVATGESVHGQATAGGGTVGESELGFLQQAALANRGGVTVAAHEARLGWALDPPTPSSLHDFGSVASQFIRAALPLGHRDFLNLDLLHAYQTFQIPPDTAHGVSPGTDDVETQNDGFAAITLIHAVGTRGSLSFGPYAKVSNIRDFPDPGNDLAGATACTAPNATCLFSLFDNRTARDIGVRATYALAAGKHAIEAGATYDAAHIEKHYAVLVQAMSSFGTSPTSIVDDTPNVAHSVGVYLQDGWQLSPAYRIDYGLRSDTFTIFSTDFRNGYARISPRVKVTRILGPRSSLYAYYGRLFTPFSFENISPAGVLNTSINQTPAFDLKPERASLYEFGGVFPLGAQASASWRMAHKRLVDVLDDAQLGATNLHQDINFADGVADIQTILAQLPRPNGSRDYVTLTHARAVNRGCGSQLFSGCPPPPYDYFDADHDQRWSAAAGKEMHLSGGAWLTITAEYGSGLSTGASCDICKVAPHLTFDAQIGRPVGPRATVVVALHNLLEDRYALTQNSSLQATHYAPPRSLDISYRASW